MSDKDLLHQYASSATLTARRGLYDANVGVSLTDRLDEQLQLNDAQSLLDVGCGYGADVATFAARYSHLRVVGFDQSENQINDARTKTPSATLFVGDANTFELNETFDRILVRHVLHLVADPSAVLDRILKHCNPTGRVVIAVHSQKSQPEYTKWRAWFKTQTGVDYSAPSDKLTLENQKDLFIRSGWETKFIEAEERIHLTDADPYLAYIKGQKRWSRELTPDELKMLLDYVQAEIEKDIVQNGYFEDASINGIIVLHR